MPLPTRPLADILPLVIPYVPGCPSYTAVQALRGAAIEFCERTRIWREILTVTITGQEEAVIVPDHAALYEMERAYWGDDESCPLIPVRFADTTGLDRSTAIANQEPRYITQASANAVTVFPFATGDLTVYAILSPRAGPESGVVGVTTKQDIQNVIPAFIFEQYSECLAEGALSRLMLMPKTEFLNPQLSAYYGAKFAQHLDAKQNRNIEGQTRARARVKPHWL